MGDLLYGIHPLYGAFAAGRREIKKLYVSRSRRSKGLEALVEQARAKGIPIQYMAPEYFQSRLGDSVHQGVAAEVGRLPLADVGAILKKAETDGTDDTNTHEEPRRQGQ